MREKSWSVAPTLVTQKCQEKKNSHAVEGTSQLFGASSDPSDDSFDHYYLNMKRRVTLRLIRQVIYDKILPLVDKDNQYIGAENWHS